MDTDAERGRRPPLTWPGAYGSLALEDTLIKWSAHTGMLFTELPFEQRPRAAIDAGFDTIEAWWPDPEIHSRWLAAVHETGVRVASINCNGGDLAAGERGFLNLPNRQSDNLADIEAALDLAQRCRAPRVSLLVGTAIDSIPIDDQWATAISVIEQAVYLAEGAGVVLMLEPLNTVETPGYLVPNAERAAEIISEVGSPNLRIMYDCYHAAMTGRDPVKEIDRFAPLIEHVQFADCPGRGAPGTGHLDLRAIVATLDHSGYQGSIGLEYRTAGPTSEAIAFLAAGTYPAAPFSIA